MLETFWMHCSITCASHVEGTLKGMGSWEQVPLPIMSFHFCSFKWTLHPTVSIPAVGCCAHTHTAKFCNCCAGGKGSERAGQVWAFTRQFWPCASTARSLPALGKCHYIKGSQKCSCFGELTSKFVTRDTKVELSVHLNRKCCLALTRPVAIANKLPPAPDYNHLSINLSGGTLSR